MYHMSDVSAPPPGWRAEETARRFGNGTARHGVWFGFVSFHSFIARRPDETTGRTDDGLRVLCVLSFVRACVRACVRASGYGLIIILIRVSFPVE